MRSLIDLYAGFVRKGLGLKSTGLSRQDGVFTESDEQEYLNAPEALVSSVGELVNALFKISGETLAMLNARDDALVGAYDEVLLRLEKELR